MSSDPLYQRCPLCRGRLWIDASRRPDAVIEVLQACPCRRSETPGYAPVGITTEELDTLVERQRALQGDPGIPIDRRRMILHYLARRLHEALASLSDDS